MFTRLTWPLIALLFAPAPVRAHRPGEEAYDRTITVRLAPKGVVVDYVLEVDAQFALSAGLGQMTLKEVRQGLGGVDPVYERFVRDRINEIAPNLLARLDGQTLTFRTTRTAWKLVDHLRCEYRFEASWELQDSRPHAFSFRESSFFEENGAIHLSLLPDDSLRVLKLTQPEEALRKKTLLELVPGDREKLRNASARFEWTGADANPPQEAPPPPGLAPRESRKGLPTLEQLLTSQRGVFLLLGLAFLLGGAHALTPGHGKTLVAAYLVGERGTIGHAILLGLVTTLTHTGVILLIAAVLPWILPDVSTDSLKQVLGFLGGLLIAALGFWLLQRRLAGKADHFHIGGHDHHHHGPGHHHHHHLPEGRPVSLGSLIALGISGGLIPCSEALALFLVALRPGQAGRAFVLLLAFSAGLAFVLVAIGIVVVLSKKLAVLGWGDSPGLTRVSRILPILSAILITALGLWLCYDSIHRPQ